MRKRELLKRIEALEEEVGALWTAVAEAPEHTLHIQYYPLWPASTDKEFPVITWCHSVTETGGSTHD